MDGEIKRIALIPAYRPDKALIGLLPKLRELGFTVVAVDDGSGSEFEAIFDEARQYATVLAHRVNCGKGAALKTGLCYIQGNFHCPYVVVTLDADGQHDPSDALRTAEAAEKDRGSLVIGARAFKGKVPLRSRLGNGITRAVFALSSGRKLSDTQTGLRAFSDEHIARMTNIPGDRYEYEMNVLMRYAREGIRIVEVPIETIYIGNNSSSHFDTVRDSYRIYKEIVKFSASSLLSFIVDYLMFCLLSALTGSVVIPNIGARLVSGSLNFTVNRCFVFDSKKALHKSIPGYIALAVFILICNTLLLSLMTDGLGMNAYLAKIIAEVTMFFVSWGVQHTAVFADNKGRKGVFAMKHRYLWAAGYGAAIVLFTGYVMLDTFVIPTVAAADATQINTQMFDRLETDTAGTADTDAGNDTAVPDDTADEGTEKYVTAPGEYKNRSGKTAPSDRPSRPGSSGSSDSSGSKSSRKKPSDTGSGSGKSPSGSSEALTTSDTASGSYKDDNIGITLSEFYENGTRIYVADIELSSAQYLKTAFANDSYGKNITAATSDTAAAKGAVLAINGDYYGARESGYVIRNGVLYRDIGSADTDVLCIYADGHFGITNSSEKTAQQLIDEDVWQAFSFGPALVEDGNVTVGANEEVGKAKASNPRTAIGIIDDLHYVFVVADGRTSESSGLSLSQLAQFMQKHGVTTAYNLDGGGSSTMWFEGKVINNPTTSGSNISERKVSDIVYIG